MSGSGLARQLAAPSSSARSTPWFAALLEAIEEVERNNGPAATTRQLVAEAHVGRQTLRLGVSFPHGGPVTVRLLADEACGSAALNEAVQQVSRGIGGGPALTAGPRLVAPPTAAFVGHDDGAPLGPRLPALPLVLALGPSFAEPYLNAQAVPAQRRLGPGEVTQPRFSSWNSLPVRRQISFDIAQFDALGPEEMLESWLHQPATRAPTNVEARIASGTEMLQHVDPSNAPLGPSDLINIVWALAARSAAQGKPFYDGAFTVWDQPSDAGDKAVGAGSRIANLTERIRANGELYARLSSHLSGFKENEAFGLDLNETLHGCLLPRGRKHLLVHLVKDDAGVPFIYFKCESHGTRGLGNLGLHTLGFARSVLRRVTGNSDAAGTRRERVPKDALARFQRAVAGHPHAARLLDEARAGGIRQMVASLDQVLLEASLQGAPAALDLCLLKDERRRIVSHYGELPLRIGREHIETLPLGPGPQKPQGATPVAGAPQGIILR